MWNEAARRRLFLRHLLGWVRSDPLRNGLSGAGIVLGIAGVIVSLALVMGENRRFLENLQLIGARTIYAWSEKAVFPLDRADRLARTLRGVERTCRLRCGRRPVAVDGRPGRSAVVLEVEATYFRILGGVRVTGRPIGPVDQALGNHVCVLGRALARLLGSPRQVVVAGRTLRVVGILEADAADSIDVGIPSANPGMAVLVPFGLGIVPRTPGHAGEQLVLQAEDGCSVEDLATRMRKLLDRWSPAATRVETSRGLLRRARSVRSHVAVTVGLFSVMVLLLGALGILNNMFSVVLERLSEIGIRMAMGATPEAIIAQFVGETLLVTVAGGLAGTLLGAVGIAGAWFLGLGAVAVPWWLPVVPVPVTVLIAVPCGGLPAWRATSLRPIESLSLR